MERTEVNVTTKICLHDLLSALDTLSKDYPMERVAEYQIERIEGAARILRSRMKDYEEKKVQKQKQEAQSKVAQAPPSGTITPVLSNVTMPSGWSFSGLAPIAVETTVGYQWNSAPAVTVLDRRAGSPSTRRTHNAPNSPYRRAGKGRRKDDVGYSSLPFIKCKECYDEFATYLCLRSSHPLPREERRKNAERRKVYDKRQNQHRRLTNNTGRRKTDQTSFTVLPAIEERRYSVKDRRSMQDASSKYLRRTLNMVGRRRTDNTHYSTYPLVNVYETVQAKAERRVNTSDRRKVNDWSHPNRHKRVSGTATRGRRSTDDTPYSELPTIKNGQFKKKK